MTQRICIIGNSHVAALRQALDARGGAPEGVSITFFGVPGRSLRDIAVQDGAVMPVSQAQRRFFRQLSGGLDHIRVDHYDAFVLIGLELSIFRWLLLYQRARQAPFRFEYGMPQIIDAEAYDLCRRHVFDDTSGGTVYRALQTLGARPVYICPQAMPVADILDDTPRWRTLFEQEDPQVLDEAFHIDMARGFPDAAEILWQPQATRAGPLLTAAEFSKFYVGPGQPRERGHDDHQHMNAAYGAHVLAQIFDRVAGLRAPLAAPEPVRASA